MTFYTLAEAARILKLSERTIQRRAHRIGKKSFGRPRFTDDEIRRMAGATR